MRSTVRALARKGRVGRSASAGRAVAGDDGATGTRTALGNQRPGLEVREGEKRSGGCPDLEVRALVASGTATAAAGREPASVQASHAPRGAKGYERQGEQGSWRSWFTQQGCSDPEQNPENSQMRKRRCDAQHACRPTGSQVDGQREDASRDAPAPGAVPPRQRRGPPRARSRAGMPRTRLESRYRPPDP